MILRFVSPVYSVIGTSGPKNDRSPRGKNVHGNNQIDVVWIPHLGTPIIHPKEHMLYGWAAGSHLDLVTNNTLWLSSVLKRLG